MEGLLSHNGKEWVVKYCNIGKKELPLYHKDVELVELIFDEDETRNITFEIIDEFSHPHLFEDIGWGDGYYCAKLKN